MAMVDSGHEARVLVVDHRSHDDEPLVAERLVCHSLDPAADLAFNVPQFGDADTAPAGKAFRQLTEEQLAQYRHQLRRRLDVQVERFDPHVIHAQHIWILAQLAVETGVPYLISAWGPELVDSQIDARYAPLAEQAAVNAGRILVPDASTLARVEQSFELDAGRAIDSARCLRLPEPSDTSAPAATICGELLALYQAVLDERFGEPS